MEFSADPIVNLTMQVINDFWKKSIDEKQKSPFSSSNKYLLNEYLIGQYNRCGQTKTLINRDSPIDLTKTYVRPKLRFSESKYGFSRNEKEENFKEGIDQIIETTGGKWLVSGPAGIGKSAFTKYLFREIANRSLIFPIYLEARNIYPTQSDSNSIAFNIKRLIYRDNRVITDHDINIAARAGAYFIIIDGFDEVDPQYRRKITAELDEFCSSAPRCPLVISSRPDSAIESVIEIKKVSILPFSKNQTCEFIEKLEYEKEKKSKFIAAIWGGEFNDHLSFIENPLLSLMTFLLYDQYNEVPTSRNKFYEKCFDVLAREHDSLKGTYKRTLFTSLSIDQMEKTIMFFCVVTFLKRYFSFDSSEIRKFAQNVASIAMSKLEIKDFIDPDLLVRDMHESISILQLDGNKYSFIHRSFQEYFVCKYIIEDREKKLKEKIERFVDIHDINLLELIVESDKDYFERDFLAPSVRKIANKIKNVDSQKNPSSILKIVIEEIHISRKHDATRIVLQHPSGIDYLCFTILTRCAAYKNLRFDHEVLFDLSYGFSVKSELEESTIKIHNSNDKKLIEMGAARSAFEVKKLFENTAKSFEDREKVLKKISSDLLDI